MLTIYGSRKKNARSGYCDGISRRGKLKIGALGVGAFGLNQAEQNCADRIWPHRFALSQNLDSGPVVGGHNYRRAGSVDPVQEAHDAHRGGRGEVSRGLVG